MSLVVINISSSIIVNIHLVGINISSGIYFKYVIHIPSISYVWYMFRANFSLCCITMSYMYKVYVISGICFKLTFLSTEELCHIAFKSY